MKISYYDLLGLIQREQEPKRISVELYYETSKTYIAEYDGDFSHYYLDDKEDESFKYYLSECFLESTMFDKCITILDEEDEFEDIEEIGYKIFESNISNRKIIDIHSQELVKIKNKINQLIKNQKKIIERLKENE